MKAGAAVADSHTYENAYLEGGEKYIPCRNSNKKRVKTPPLAVLVQNITYSDHPFARRSAE